MCFREHLRKEKEVQITITLLERQTWCMKMSEESIRQSEKIAHYTQIRVQGESDRRCINIR